ncbi:hypothetical protein MA16_Dca016786 [Dendrobium catenatum]|uniref:Uncharacterized protein n=1 Tax=Dendrobium catenatum TaxID=906689 RepID=A0A2I0WZF4_9ASPA|nr:hypothetical protein MA16_Dca016786 [Dendrobium catenatum]
MFAGGIAQITPEKFHDLGFAREVEDEILTVDFNQRRRLDPAEGSSSGLSFSTKNQKKNYLRKLWKKISKAKKVGSFKTLAQVEPEAVEELPIRASSPLLKGSHFYPLASTQGEETIARIAHSPPCPSGKTKEEYVKQLKRIISHHFQKEILKEEISEATNITPQPASPLVIIVNSLPTTSSVHDPVVITTAPFDDLQDLSVVLRLSSLVSEDLTLPYVGAITLHAPASPPEAYVSHLIEDSTLLTTSSRIVKEEITDEDLEMKDEPILEPQLDPNPKLT